MGYGVQQDAYDAACRALERTKGQLADLRLRINRLITEAGPEGEAWPTAAIDQLRQLLEDGTPVAYDPRLRIVDVAQQAREAFGTSAVNELMAAVGGVARDHDYRFEIDTPTGGETTFNPYATAEYVAARIAEITTEAKP